MHEFTSKIKIMIITFHCWRDGGSDSAPTVTLLIFLKGQQAIRWRWGRARGRSKGEIKSKKKLVPNLHKAQTCRHEIQACLLI